MNFYNFLLLRSSQNGHILMNPNVIIDSLNLGKLKLDWNLAGIYISQHDFP